MKKLAVVLVIAILVVAWVGNLHSSWNNTMNSIHEERVEEIYEIDEIVERI